MTILRDATRPIHVSSADVHEHVRPALAIEAARAAAVGYADGTAQGRRLLLPYDGGWMRVMAASIPALDVFGYKEFHLSPGNRVRYVIHLFSLTDGRPIGIVDGALMTTLRTAAAGALATESFFGHGQSLRLGVIGTGAEALAGVRALSMIATLTDISVTSRSEENRAKFVRSVGEELGLDARPAASARDASRGTDLVYVATNSGGKVVVTMDDVDGVPFIASIGSTLPSQRELDGAVLAEATDVVLDTYDALEESGDALAAAKCGLDRLRVSLLGDMTSRTWDRHNGQTIYKSIGSPEQDVSLAHAVIEAARTRNFGTPMEALSSIKQNL
jgi:alanine dehydrogenase